MGFTDAIRNADAIYLGATEADKVYVGSTLLYEGFDPLSLSPALWLKADAGTSTTTDGAGVSQWDDQSGNTRNATQATAARQPLYKPNVLNGKPVLRFNDPANFMHMATAAFEHGAQWTLLAVAKTTSSSDQQRLAGSADSELVARLNAGVSDVFGATSASEFVEEAAAANSFYVFTARRATATFQAWVNGASANGSKAVAAGATGSSVLTIGMHPSFVQPLSGDLAEIILCPTALSSDARESAQSYLATKYGISLA